MRLDYKFSFNIIVGEAELHLHPLRVSGWAWKLNWQKTD